MADAGGYAPETFQSWLRGHFRLDSSDLAEISTLIAVPGLPDVDMPDVLSLLDDEEPPPWAAAGAEAAATACSAWDVEPLDAPCAPQQQVQAQQQPEQEQLQAREQQQQQHQQQQGPFFDFGVLPPQSASLPCAPDSGGGAADAGEQGMQQQAAASAAAHALGCGQPGGGGGGSSGGQAPPPLPGARARRSSAGAAAAAAGAAPVPADGGVKRRKRQPTEAQRAAHRRFRQRRKEQMRLLEETVAAKRAQLQSLSLEHMALSAKARALDQLVASAGDDMELLQQLEQLSIAAAQQQLQEQQQLELAEGSSSPSSSSQRLPALELAPLPGGGDGGEGALRQLLGSAGQPMHRSRSGASMSSSGGGGGGGVGSIEHLEVALQRVLSVSAPPRGGGLPAASCDRGALSTLQSLLKSLVSEVMALVLQVNAAAQAGGGGGGAKPRAAAEEAGGAAPAAAARLQWLMQQVHSEFKSFAVVNRLSLYHLNTLNLEDGAIDAPPPVGHWAKVAQVLKERLPPGLVTDLCCARQLYCSAVARIKQQRQLLIVQLQHAINLSLAQRTYRTGVSIRDLHGPQCQGAALLDAIDSNLRKEYTLEGVFQWSFFKLVPPLLRAELMVHSWPFITDSHSVLAELANDPEHLPALSALQELELQQLAQAQAQEWAALAPRGAADGAVLPAAGAPPGLLAAAPQLAMQLQALPYGGGGPEAMGLAGPAASPGVWGC